MAELEDEIRQWREYLTQIGEVRVLEIVWEGFYGDWLRTQQAEMA